MQRKPTSFQTMFSQVQEGRKKDPTLSNWATGVQATQAGATQQAAQQTQEKSKEESAKTSEEAIKTGMGPSQYGTFATPTITSNWQTPAHADTTKANWDTWAGVLGTDYGAQANQAATQATADIAKQQQEKTAAAEATQAKIEKGQSDFLKGLQGLVSADTHNLGQTTQPSALESQAAGVQDVLAQPSTSNVAALKALLGTSYDPRLAALESGIYEGSLSGLRGEAAAGREDLAQAERGRQQSLEGYLTGRQRAGERLAGAQGKIGLTETGEKYSDSIIKSITDRAGMVSENIKRAAEDFSKVMPAHVRQEFQQDLPRLVNPTMEAAAKLSQPGYTPTVDELKALAPQIDAIEARLDLIRTYAPDLAKNIEDFVKNYKAYIPQKIKELGDTAARKQKDLENAAKAETKSAIKEAKRGEERGDTESKNKTARQSFTTEDLRAAIERENQGRSRSGKDESGKGGGGEGGSRSKAGRLEKGSK